jgi:hypothetical protein
MDADLEANFPIGTPPLAWWEVLRRWRRVRRQGVVSAGSLSESRARALFLDPGLAPRCHVLPTRHSSAASWYLALRHNHMGGL